MKSSADLTPGSEPARRAAANGYCDHTGARQIRLYMSYADANTIRLRAAPRSPEAHVSWLYEIPGGWAWTICRECAARDRQSA